MLPFSRIAELNLVRPNVVGFCCVSNDRNRPPRRSYLCQWRNLRPFRFRGRRPHWREPASTPWIMSEGMLHSKCFKQ